MISPDKMNDLIVDHADIEAIEELIDRELVDIGCLREYVEHGQTSVIIDEVCPKLVRDLICRIYRNGGWKYVNSDAFSDAGVTRFCFSMNR